MYLVLTYPAVLWDWVWDPGDGYQYYLTVVLPWCRGSCVDGSAYQTVLWPPSGMNSRDPPLQIGWTSGIACT